MVAQPPAQPVPQDSEELYCYGHPNTPTRLRCSRCDRPICGRCAIPASVGQHCPECVAEARRTTRRARSTFAAVAPAVRAIIIVSVATFIAEALIPGFIERFAMVPFAIADGQWWRLLTPMLLHAGILHIFLNMYVLSIFGPIVERVFKTRPFVAMYVICGFGGSVASYLFSGCAIRGVGASGAIFGLAGALLVYFWRRRELSSMAPYLRSLWFFVAINLVFGFGVNLLPISGFRIDNFAHLGGLVTGMTLGFGFDVGEGRTAQLSRMAIATAVVVVGIMLVMARTANFSC